MGINEEIAKAFGAHGAWKARIAQAIDSGHSEHKPEDVSIDNRCAFGKWLYDPSLPASVRTSQEYQTVVRLHADFHKAAGSTLSKALKGDHGGAHADLTDGGFAQAADALSSSMVHWQRVAATECSGYRSRSWRAVCFFWKGRVALRIWAAIAIPTLAAIATAAAFDAQLVATAGGAGRMEQATILLTEATATVHEMQKERGISVASATKADDKLSARRRDQVTVTDRSRKALETVVGPILSDLPVDVRNQWQAVTAELQQIEAIRAKIDAGGEEPPKIVSTFTSAIDKMIRLEEAAQVLAVNPDVARAMTALLRVSRAKEAAGQERAIGAAAIVSGTVTPAARKRLMELSIDQAVRFSAFSDGATVTQRQALEQAMADPSVTQFEKFRTALQDGESAGLNAEGWFNAATTRIDRLHQVEYLIVTEIRETASARKAKAWRDLSIFTGLTVAAMIGGGLLVIFLARGITRPVIQLTSAMRQLASGQTRIDIPATERPDEIGEMGRAVLVFQQQSLTVEQMTADAERQRRKSEEDRRQALTTMADTIESQAGQVVTRVADDSGRINDTAGRMAQSATRVEDNAQRVATAAGQSLANAQAVAGASEELSASIREIAAQVARSKEIVGEAVNASSNASGTVGSLTEAMAAIDQVVQVIADIASQTNLLALNATIEAARAGEAGKGFAVVAHEVKNLANQTAKQTEDITTRITILKEMAERVTRAIAEVVDRIHGVEEIAGSVAAAVEEQDAATKEIARNVQQSAQAAQEVSERIVAVAEEAASTGKQAATVETLLDAMANQVEELGHVLTKVVRTATPDVNRRAAPRFAIKTRAKLACGQAEVEGELADISVGGARVVGLSQAPGGQSCVLKVEGVAVPMTVIESQNGVCRMKVPPGHGEEIGQWISRNVPRDTAA